METTVIGTVPRHLRPIFPSLSLPGVVRALLLAVVPLPLQVLSMHQVVSHGLRGVESQYCRTKNHNCPDITRNPSPQMVLSVNRGLPYRTQNAIIPLIVPQ